MSTVFGSRDYRPSLSPQIVSLSFSSNGSLQIWYLFAFSSLCISILAQQTTVYTTILFPFCFHILIKFCIYTLVYVRHLPSSSNQQLFLCFWDPESEVLNPHSNMDNSRVRLSKYDEFSLYLRFNIMLFLTFINPFYGLLHACDNFF